MAGEGSGRRWFWVLGGMTGSPSGRGCAHTGCKGKSGREAFKEPQGYRVHVPNLGGTGSAWMLCTWFWDPAPKKTKQGQVLHPAALTKVMF